MNNDSQPLTRQRSDQSFGKINRYLDTQNGYGNGNIYTDNFERSIDQEPDKPSVFLPKMENSKPLNTKKSTPYGPMGKVSQKNKLVYNP